MPEILLAPDLLGSETRLGRWMVVIHNNDVTPFDEVIDALIRAIDCDIQEASIEAWEAHTFGKAPVHFSSQTECQEAATIIAAIGVKTEVTPEWQD